MKRWLVATVCIAFLATACAAGDGESPPGSPSPPNATASPTTEPTDGAEPAIVVDRPAPGEEVASPVRISGTADVFEATVSIRIRAEDGHELAATFATATCGSGCRGEFSAQLFFFVDRTQDGTIEVFESSAEDGSPINVVSIPVVLVAG